MQTITTDVAIIGASVAGSAAATLLARHGLRVLLVDRVQDPAAYKKQCTHSIVPSAVPVLERLGVIGALEQAGARAAHIQLWTAAGGWLRFGLDQPGTRDHGYNIRREKLDPILRDTAARTAGVTLALGHTATALRRDASGRCTGVELDGPDGPCIVEARLVVGADGRHTKIAELAGIETEIRPHDRGGFFAYDRGVTTPVGDDSQFWILGEDVAYAFPTDDGLTCLAVVVNERKLAEFRADREGYLRAFYARLPGAPDLSRAERVGNFIGAANTPNTYRWPAHPGLALVGDAAMASDYIWGVGCGWALEGAALLADAVGPALVAGGDVDAALRTYARAHKDRLYALHVQNTAFSAAPKLPWMMGAMLAAGAQDPAIRRLMTLQALGQVSARDPRFLLHLARWYVTRPFRARRPAVAARAEVTP